MSTLTYTGTLVIDTCHCGIVHAIPSDLHREARENGKKVYCPLGHVWVFRESDVRRLEREAAELKQQRDNARIARDAARDQAAAAERRRAAAKGQLTKTRKRIANGVCPCCNRSFVDVQRHMATKHPELSGVVS